jgi:hypothetical protein
LKKFKRIQNNKINKHRTNKAMKKLTSNKISWLNNRKFNLLVTMMDNKINNNKNKNKNKKIKLKLSYKNNKKITN